MGLRDLAKRLTADTETLDQKRLAQRFASLDVTAISDLECRKPSRIGGEVIRTQVTPRQGIPALEIVLRDGTGDAIAIFTGRRTIGGIECGRAMVIEGVARNERGHSVMLNPGYTLLAG